MAGRMVQDPRREHVRRVRRTWRRGGFADRADGSVLVRYAVPVEVGADDRWAEAELALGRRPPVLPVAVLPGARDRDGLHRRQDVGHPGTLGGRRVPRGADRPQPRERAGRAHDPDRRGQRLRRPVRGQGRAQEGRRLRRPDRGRSPAPPVCPRDVQARDRHLRVGTGERRRDGPDIRRPGRAARQLDDRSRRRHDTGRRRRYLRDAEIPARPEAGAPEPRGRPRTLDRERSPPGMRCRAADRDLPAQPGRPGSSPLLAAGGRRQEPAGRRVAVVHDDVRPRQHLHQPPVAAVHARAGGHDAAGARRLAGQPS